MSESVMAVVSKAIFEKQAPKGLTVGGVWDVDRYVSKNPGLSSVAGGGALFLITVRPPDERLWLVAVLESPELGDEGWTSPANVVPVTDITPLLPRLVLATGKGIKVEKGKLGMSLQTPRVLAASDVVLLRAALGSKATAKPAKLTAPKAEPPKAAPKAVPPKVTPIRKPATVETKAASPTAKPASTALGKRLAKAAAALPDDPALALEELIDAWRAQPAAELAALVAGVQRLIPTTPFVGNSDEWVRAAKKVDVAGRAALVAGLGEGRMGDISDRLEAAHAWGPDPRVADWLIDLITNVPFTSDSSLPFWATVWQAIDGQKDPRFVPLATSLPPTWKIREGIRPKLGRALGRAVAELPPAVTLAPDELVQIAELHQRFKPAAKGGHSEAEFLAAIYADPDDDGPRMVYADWLADKGDPRAELIALQCSAEKSPANDKRIRKLLAEHGKTWLGSIAPAVGAKFEFARGFLSKASIKLKNGGDTQRYGDLPEWSTVEELEWMVPGQAPVGQEEFVRHIGPAMLNLRVAQGPSATKLLQAKQPWRIEDLLVVTSDPHLFRRLLTSPLLPLLKIIRTDYGPTPSWLLGLGQVTPHTLEIGDDRAISEWLAAMAPTSLTTLVVNTDNGEIRFVRDGKGPFRMESTGETTPAATKAQIDNVPSPLASVVSIRWCTDGIWTGTEDRIALFDPKTSRLLRGFPIRSTDDLVFSADGKRAFSSSYHHLATYDTEAGEPEWQHQGANRSSKVCCISRDGRLGLAASEGEAYFCDLEKKAIVRSVPAEYYYEASLAPDGSAWAQTTTEGVAVFTPASKKPVAEFGASADTLCWLDDGRLVCGLKDRLEIYAPLTGELLKSKPAKSVTLALSRGKQLLGLMDKHLVSLDTETLEIIWKVRTDYGPLAFSPDGKRIALVSEGKLHLFDAASGQKI